MLSIAARDELIARKDPQIHTNTDGAIFNNASKNEQIKIFNSICMFEHVTLAFLTILLYQPVGKKY